MLRRFYYQPVYLMRNLAREVKSLPGWSTVVSGPGRWPWKPGSDHYTRSGTVPRLWAEQPGERGTFTAIKKLGGKGGGNLVTDYPNT